MGRKKTIDRDAILDAAEEIVQSRGPAALTIDALAKAIGITKGGVQYSFGSKDAILDAMFERWGQAYNLAVDHFLEQDSSPVGVVKAHIQATALSDESTMAKAAGLMASLTQSPEHLAGTRNWYRERIQHLDIDTESGRNARLAFLAAEGAFLLRHMGLMKIDDETWSSIFDDIKKLTP
ncbi:TetR family transcriptional regulator [Rhizobium panacihumi]|uniref:TetR/AcrR family transcriptional regulator n=1 Tax=Rhizobium panacihumi TaxID=2008450 RepID=UPI003D79A437